jgi:hypothetical protein
MSTIWRCTSCGTSNGAADAVCVVCHQPRSAAAAPAVPNQQTVPVVARTAPPAAPVSGPNAPGPAAVPPAPAGRPPGRRVPTGVAIGLVVLVLAVGAIAFVAGRGSSSDGSSTASSGDTSEIDTSSGDPTIDEAPPDDTGSDTGSDIGSDVESEQVDETTTSVTSSGLVLHEALGVRILVPPGWTESVDEPGGSSSTVTYTDPSGDGEIRVAINGCAGCIDEGMATGGDFNGVPYPEGQVPSDAFGVVELSPVSVAYARPTASPDLSTDGVVRVQTYDGEPEVAYTIEVTLPTSEHETARQILNSTEGLAGE